MRKAPLSDGERFLRELAELPPDTYENFFARCALELGLGMVFDRNDLRLLYEASFSATACNLAFNTHCLCADGGQARNEARRTRLEREFMAARDLFYASPGWQNLPDSRKESIAECLLRVVVRDDLMAW